MIKKDWEMWMTNVLRFSLPLFTSTLFAQLAMGVEFKKAIAVSLLTFYGALADYIKKLGTETKYK